MEFLRRASNPWGQDILVGISWDLMWAAIIIGVAFLVVHAVYAKWLAPTTGATTADERSPQAAGLPERILRHAFSARVFHWLMSLTMFVLLVTAFLPVIGIKFAWVTIHWIAGIGLLVTIVYHIVHAWFFEDRGSMNVGRQEVREGTEEVRRFLTRAGPSPGKAGKYPLDHKLYHHTIAVVTVGAIATGLLMMVRVDTPFWERNPYLLSDGLWGWVYVVHGLSGVALITMIMAHIYFAIRPEKWWITVSMIKGWVSRQSYLEHHDPNKWIVPREVPPSLAGVSASSPVGDGVPRDKHSDP